MSSDLIIISDEAYCAFVYDDGLQDGFFDMEDIRDRLIVVRSFSKTYGMTGFRVGYVAAPREIIAALGRLQSHLTGNVCTFAQEGALAALSLDPLLIERELCADSKKEEIWPMNMPCDSSTASNLRAAFTFFRMSRGV